MDAADLRSEPRVVWPRSEGVEYDSSHAVIDGEDVLFILHNDGALDFELVRVAASDPAGARQVVVPHRPGERLLGVSTFRDWACSATAAAGSRASGCCPMRTAPSQSSSSTSRSTRSARAATRSGRRPLIRIGYGSFVTPGTVYDYEVATGELLLRKRQPVLGGYEPEPTTRRRGCGRPRRTARRSRSPWSGSARSATPGAAPASAAPLRLRLL